MKNFMNAEVIEHRGRISRVKFPDGLIVSIPTTEHPVGSHILIAVERKE